jgi:P-type E1-E2 ATPase
MRRFLVPGSDALELEHLVLDLNGTLSERGELIDGVAARLAELARDLEIHVLTADTLGTAGRIAGSLPVALTRITTGADKAALVERLGARRSAAIGNGNNDAAMLRTAALGVAVIGPEGAAGPAVAAADVVCRSIADALDLLLDERSLGSTLRR